MLPCGLNYVGVRFANIAIGVICVTLELYAREKSFFKDDVVDVPFIIVTGVCALEALIFITSFHSHHNVEMIWRFLCCSALVTVGILLVNSAVRIQRFCENFPPDVGLRNCQLYEMKVTAGILAILNGIIYTLAKFSRSDIHRESPFDAISQVSENNHLISPSPNPGIRNPIRYGLNSNDRTNSSDPGLLESININDNQSDDRDPGQFCDQDDGHSIGRQSASGQSPSPPQPIIYPRGYHPHVPLRNHSTWENQHTKTRFPYPVLHRI